MSDSPDRRSDADALLARVVASEASAARGRLRIYFGASAGVGKTYAMLLDAKRLLEEGQDVVIGVIETHGRTKTAQLLESLPIPVLPLRIELVQAATQREFDLDGALKRRPKVILVDELAHTNLAGSRHPKRWQDVDELLNAGIDVMTAVNVQHLESLRDVVYGITGVRVAETLPDTFFESASEVVLVDLPTPDLLERLRTGQVYAPEQALRASRNFFRAGNLYALRELALRRTARTGRKRSAELSGRTRHCTGLENPGRIVVLHWTCALRRSHRTRRGALGCGTRCRVARGVCRDAGTVAFARSAAGTHPVGRAAGCIAWREDRNPVGQSGRRCADRICARQEPCSGGARTLSQETIFLAREQCGATWPPCAGYRSDRARHQGHRSNST